MTCHGTGKDMFLHLDELPLSLTAIAATKRQQHILSAYGCQRQRRDAELPEPH